ncbi:IPT/TIG domain-containing protein, partial [bacterium]|nr:IPT/TIG domain-containing protein [bacterium]
NGTGAGSFTVDSDSQLRAVVPPAATTGKIKVTTLEGTAESEDDFIVISQPTVSMFSPASGPMGSEVIIRGTNFVAVSEVSFNAAIASDFEVLSATEIRAIVPSDAEDGPIVVTNPVGEGRSLADFSIIFVPNLTSFNPMAGPVGTEVTITGVNFTGVVDVAFDGIGAAEFSVDSDTQIRASVAPGSTTGLITVTNADGAGHSSEHFAVIVKPTIHSFLPDNGSVGTVVNISGVNFSGLTDVAFGGISASNFEILSDTQLRAELPNGAETGIISITNSAGTAASSSDFVVVELPSSLTLNPSEDSFVRSSAATRNYGQHDELTVRRSSAHYVSYLKFDLQSIRGTIEQAVLSLKVTDASPEGGEIYSVSNNYA